jgi:diguanylate cyclase
MTHRPASAAHQEATRLATLAELRVLDTLPEQVYDDLVQLAAQICGVPIALVSLVDVQRQWFKARLGLAPNETHRELAFCSHAIAAGEPVFVVGDAAEDPRFSTNALVTGDPHIRFYAGAPIVMPGGQAMGTVCVIDTVPRALTPAQLGALQALARQAAALFELRRQTQLAQQTSAAFERLSNESADERRRSAELLELVLRSGDLGLWDLHVPSARYTTNERERAMLGYSAEEAEGGALVWSELVHPEDLPMVNATVVAHLKGQTAFYECEHRMRHRSGHWVWVQGRGVVVERDASGAALRIVGTHLEVTERRRNAQALQRASDLLQRMGALAKVGGWELEIETGTVSWTDEVYRIHEVDPQTPLALLANIEFYAPQARSIIQAAIDNAIRHGTPYDLELDFVTAKGRALTVRTQGELVCRNGKAERLFGTFQDITERKAAEQVTIDAQRRLRTIADNVPAMIAHIDSEQRYRFLNEHVARLYRLDLAAVIGRTMREVRGEAAYATLAPHVAAALRGEPAEFEYTERINGRECRFQSNYVPDVDAQGQVRGFHALSFDITELHATQRQLEQLAHVDELTGLPNRRQFDARMVEAMGRVRRNDKPMAVMFLDVDHFKVINDTLGHAGGDAVLREFARRVKGCVRSTDTVARLAGDEFVVLVEGLAGAAELGRLADKVVACIRPRFRVAEGGIDVTASVGVAVYSGEARSAGDLLSLADAALYRAKKQGRDRFELA